MSLINMIRKLHIAAVVKATTFLKEEKGAAGIEYAITATLVAVVLVSFSSDIKTGLDTVFGQICDALGSECGIAPTATP
ncbi:Flp family type IVb pilin [Pseudomonas segetis]|uniref:Flp pilus assembly protein, pilin Flp n=1 Tax=Pseudomonas segetis TaxID=298908 RepID=A0A239DCQ8_9PSED|nr:Flp family type IVb pilin [Pseudomonas segetis]SNS29691.1 Flp pilus assembly protein, pilin Flp [Pseudomonas segetis]